MIGLGSQHLCRTSSFELKMLVSHVRLTNRSRGTWHLEREHSLRWIVSLIYLACMIPIIVLLSSWLRPEVFAQIITN
jgi:hypothetical protein